VEGSGVGLVITKNLIEMMGGEICVYSQEGVGSCFEIHLPRADAEQSTDAEPKDVVDIDTSVVLKLDEPKTVLYLEDNPDDIRLIDSVMKSVDQLTLHVAEDALLGLFKARTLCPDLIIIDLNIAGLDLENTLAILKDEPSLRTTPIFGLGTQAEKVNTNGADPDAHQLDMFFQKPINLEQFLSGLQHYLGSAEVVDRHTSEFHS
jgi:CheY-like chemotaxis protein